ncbi:LOW QUALITY PROTEIN: uncharacterized protein LOC110181729 [Drosophila serrata]|uniref:LOW QUALITY PROTEIN: uncharacterized protein LOC110181729 n=1 Tax=Drosophila serrata TaxID=7274 RepID=UPI000A1D1838|nr:LOW QUALITY PROTEIN: uncharacterized protein LOC110181729 [Drosophila serrata]
MDGLPFLHRPSWPARTAPIPTPVRPANCVNGKATAAFANFATKATQKKGEEHQLQQKQRILHKCIYIYLSDGRALYCSYVLDGPAKWRIEKKIKRKKSLKQNQQRSCQKSSRISH